MAKVRKRKGDHVVCGTADGGCLHCTHCGETFPFPIGDMTWVVEVVRAYAKAHTRCKPGQKHDGRLCGLQPLRGVHDGVPLDSQPPTTNHQPQTGSAP